MPEWVTHALLGLLVAEIFSVRKKSIVVLGALLPDMIIKLTLLRLFIPIPNFDYAILGAFHTPFPLLLFTILISPLFRYDHLTIIAWLNLGALTHFLSDALLRHLGSGGVRLLYPFTAKYYTLGLIWPDDTLWIGLATAILYFGIIAFKKIILPRIHHGTATSR